MIAQSLATGKWGATWNCIPSEFPLVTREAAIERLQEWAKGSDTITLTKAKAGE